MALATPHQSLNVHVPWVRLLPLLASQTQTHVLPAVVKCPLCSGQLKIFPDSKFGGQWHWCQDCRHHGDMIGLAAATWKLSLTATIAKLMKNGFDIPTDPSLIQAHNQQYVESSRQATTLWTQARRGFVHDNTTAHRLIHSLGLRCDTNPDRFADGPGQLLGVLHHIEIEKLFAPASVAKGRNTGVTRRFRGKGWDHVLLVPFWDLPDRISSWLCIGRNGDPEKDYVQCLIGHQFNNNTELGICLHPTLLQSAAGTHEKLIAIADPLLAIRLQFRQFEDSSLPLPIVAWQHRDGETTKSAWQMLYNRKLVFWSPTKLTAQVIRQAILTHGEISLVGPESNSPHAMKIYLQHYTPQQLLQHIESHALPWPRAIARYLARLTDIEIEELMLLANLTSAELAKVIKHSRPRVQQQLSKLTATDDTRYRMIPMNTVDVFEQQDSWFAMPQRQRFRTTRKPELIMDAALRITHVIHHARADKTYYRGYVRYRGEQFEFCELRDVVEKNALNWIKTLLIRQGKGLLKHNPTWNKRIVSIATQFHEAEFVRGIDQIGWDQEQQRFVLPNYSLPVGQPCVTHRGQLFPDAVPAGQLSEPATLSPEEWDQLAGAGYTEQLTMATFVSILANILSPAYSRAPVGISLHGHGAETVGREVATALGCLSVPLHSSGAVPKVIAEEAKHNWPIFVDVGQTRRLPLSGELQWREEQPNHNCLLTMNWPVSTAKAITGGWDVIHGTTPATVSPTVLATLGKLLPAYLQDLCQRRLNLSGWQSGVSNWWSEVAADLNRFAVAQGGRCPALDDLASVVRPDSDSGHPEAFAAILSHLVLQAKITLIPRGFEEPGKSMITFCEDGQTLTIPRTVLLGALAKLHIVLDPLRITAILSQANVLRDEDEFAWIVDHEWWYPQFRLARATGTGQLRIA